MYGVLLIIILFYDAYIKNECIIKEAEYVYYFVSFWFVIFLLHLEIVINYCSFSLF
jgi:hypothetical protein